MSCPKWQFLGEKKYFTDQNGPKVKPHGNEFWVFSNSEMNVRNSVKIDEKTGLFV